MEGSDGVADQAVAHKMNFAIDNEREELALHLHEGLTEAFELELAGRVDFGDLLGLHIQDNPV